MADVSRAAGVLAAGLLFGPLLAGGPSAPDCASPGVLSGGPGSTRMVRCEGGAALRGPARLLFGLRLDPNRADATSLETLPGIGPARAAAIVAERQRRPFASLEALTRVRGIGPGTLEALRPWLEVAGGDALRGRSSG